MQRAALMVSVCKCQGKYFPIFCTVIQIASAAGWPCSMYMYTSSLCCLAQWDLFEQQLAQMCISLVRWRGAISLQNAHFANLPTAISKYPISPCFSLCNYSLVALCHYLSSRSSFICSLIYGASSLCQLHQDYGQLHKHFTDKDGQLFTDEAKVLLAAATIWVWMGCVFLCMRVCVCGVCARVRL